MDPKKLYKVARGRLEWQSKTEGQLKTEAWILPKEQPDTKAREARSQPG